MPELTPEEQRAINEAFWIAARDGDLEALKAQKEKGPNVNWMHPSLPPGRAYQFSPLHIASDGNHKECVKFLVEKCGCDLNKKASFSETACQHLDGRQGKNELHSYLKMKVAMQAVLAAQKFAANKQKATLKKEAEAAA